MPGLVELGGRVRSGRDGLCARPTSVGEERLLPLSESSCGLVTDTGGGGGGAADRAVEP